MGVRALVATNRPPAAPAALANELWGAEFVWDSSINIATTAYSVYGNNYSLSDYPTTTVAFPDGSEGDVWSFDGYMGTMVTSNLCYNGVFAQKPSLSLTMEIWFYPTINGTTLLTELGSPSYNGYFHATFLEINSNGTIWGRFWNFAGVTTANTVNLNAWNHVWMQYDDATKTVSVRLNNGTVATETGNSRAGSAPYNNNFYLGIAGKDGTNHGNYANFQGYIGKIRVMNWSSPSNYWGDVSKYLNITQLPATDNLQLWMSGKVAPSGGGYVWADISGNYRQLNLTGGTHDAVNNVYSFATGEFAGASDPNNYGLYNNTEATMTMWVNTPTPNFYMNYAGFRNNSTLDYYLLALNANHTTEFRIRNSGGTYIDGTPVSLTDFYDRWTHFTCRLTAGNAKLYVNGKLAASDSWSGVLGASQTALHIFDPSYHGNVTKKVADFQLYNRALTEDEIWQNYSFDRNRLLGNT
jgi:Concanavalin A-like lectin/glucanases superfamily